MSLERLPSSEYDLLSEIQRVNLDLSDYINDKKIDIRWLKNVDHIGIEAAGYEDFKEIFNLLSRDAVNAYKGLVYHRYLAAIELSEGIQVQPNDEHAKWIELIGPREREIPTNHQFTGMPWYPDANNIHFGYFHEDDDGAYEHFFRQRAEPVSNWTPRRNGFVIKINSTGDTIQIVNKPLNEIIKEIMKESYDGVNLRQI